MSPWATCSLLFYALVISFELRRDIHLRAREGSGQGLWSRQARLCRALSVAGFRRGGVFGCAGEPMQDPAVFKQRREPVTRCADVESATGPIGHIPTSDAQAPCRLRRRDNGARWPFLSVFPGNVIPKCLPQSVGILRMLI